MILKSPMNSENPAPIIPKGRPISGDDWLKGRRDRRETRNRVAPEINRRSSSASDHRLRPLFNGERGLPFKKAVDL
jgi:hypothetical protein